MKRGWWAVALIVPVLVVVAIPVTRRIQQERHRAWFSCFDTASTGSVRVVREPPAGSPFEVSFNPQGGSASGFGEIDARVAHRWALEISKVVRQHAHSLNPSVIDYSAVTVEGVCGSERQTLVLTPERAPGSLSGCDDQVLSEKVFCAFDWLRDRWRGADATTERVLSASQKSKFDLVLISE